MVKNRKNKASVSAFLKSLDAPQRADCEYLCKLMTRATGSAPAMWGDSMVGFGNYQYTYASGRSGEWFVTGFAPRKNSLSVYIMPGFAEFADLMSVLGRFKTGKSCLYIKNLEDIDVDTLEKIVVASVAVMEEKYACQTG